MPEIRHQSAAITLGPDSGCTNHAVPDSAARVAGDRHLA
jgi:hypothetical protein